MVLAISAVALGRYIQSGYLKVIKLGPRLVRVDPESVQNLLDNGIPENFESETGSTETEAVR